MPVYDSSAKVGTLRIFFVELYTLLALESSTNHRNETIFEGTIKTKYGKHY